MKSTQTLCVCVCVFLCHSKKHATAFKGKEKANCVFSFRLAWILASRLKHLSRKLPSNHTKSNCLTNISLIFLFIIKHST